MLGIFSTNKNKPQQTETVLDDKSIGYVRNLINDTCIQRVPKNSRELPKMGGGFYTWQFYLRNALLDATCLRLIGEDFWNKNETLFRERPFQVAGLESACVPLLVAIVLEAAKRGIKVNAFTIRKTRKEYGLRNIIEGCPTSEPVFFVDDLTSPQHNAFWAVMNVLQLQGLKINLFGYVLVLKKMATEPRVIETSMGFMTIQSLFTLSDFDLAFEEYNNKLK
jgi:orotate phosphoribosyltransferase